MSLLIVLLASRASAEPRGAVCRVHNRLTTATNVGSGTLIDRTDDGREGLVLTCAHLFSEGAGEVVVSFPGGKTHGAKLVAIDRRADLAALAITNPAPQQVAVDFEIRDAETVKACGFGPTGEYRCAEGPVVGQAANHGQTSVLVGDAVRSGDSGGGVFDNEGHLVGVVWGEAGGITYASSGVPLKRFLDRVLGRRTGHVYACPNGVCPRPGFGGVVSTPRTPRNAPLAEAGSPVGFEELQQRVAALEQNKQDRGDYVTRGEATQYMVAANERYESLLKQVGVKPQGVRSLWEKIGITGPAGWGVVAVTTIGGWLAGWMLRRGVGGRRRQRFLRHNAHKGEFRTPCGTDVSRDAAADRA